MFRQVTISCTSDLVISFMNFFNGIEWQPHLTCSLIVRMDFSMSPIFSFTAHVYRCAGDKKYQMRLNSFSPWKSVMVNPLSWYLDLTCFRPDIFTDFPLLLHYFTELKYILPDFVCRKGIPFKKKKSIAISTLWWCLEMAEVRLLWGFSFGALASFWWIFLVWWVYMVSIWPLIYLCHPWWLGSFWFGIF